MNKLSKEKRQRLIVVLLSTAVVILGLWFGLINVQKQSLVTLSDRRDQAVRKLDMMKKAIDNADKVDAELATISARLSKLEDGMATGDLLAWTINSIRQFKLAYKIEIPQFSQIDGPKDMSLFADFPYKQATLTVAGNGFYQDLGRFIADFENQYPYARIQNLSMEPMVSGTANDREKLLFRMDVVVLVKPNAS